MTDHNGSFLNLQNDPKLLTELRTSKCVLNIKKNSSKDSLKINIYAIIDSPYRLSFHEHK
jgi:hypothetical protein